MVLALALVALLSACSTPSSSTTTSTAVRHQQSLKQIRARYLAIVGPANTQSLKFATAFAAVLPTTTRSAVAALVAPEVTEIKQSGRSLEDLAAVAPTKIAQAVQQTVLADNLVYQALLDLGSSWGNRAFNLSGWEAAFSGATQEANSTSNALRNDLGLPQLHASSQ